MGRLSVSCLLLRKSCSDEDAVARQRFIKIIKERKRSTGRYIAADYRGKNGSVLVLSCAVVAGCQVLY